jgi:hypothetical protein
MPLAVVLPSVEDVTITKGEARIQFSSAAVCACSIKARRLGLRVRAR